MILENMSDMVWYLEKKFTSSVFEATAKPLEKFGDVVKFEVTWTATNPENENDKGFIWCTTTARTAAVPFSKKSKK